MTHLSKLKPAETLYLMDVGVNLKTLLKNTFMDLVFKGVLNLEERSQEYMTRDKYNRKVSAKKTYRYVSAGKALDSYIPQTFEFVFLEPFKIAPDLKTLMESYVKIIAKSTNSESSFKRKILKSANLSSLVKANFLQRVFAIYSLSEKGKQVKKEIANTLKTCEAKFPELVKSDPGKAVELMMKIGGNIFLVENLDLSLLNKLDKNVVKAQLVKIKDQAKNKGKHDYADNDYFDEFDEFDDFLQFEMMLDVFEDTFNSFDSFESFDSFDSGFDSSFNDSFSDFSGDSGCSSCSGCGGCGGD